MNNHLKTTEDLVKGKLYITGIGPGGQGWLSREAHQILTQVDDWVGYSAYLKQLGPPPPQVRCHEFAIGSERERAVVALEKASQGRKVALISSGDSGIFGMAGVVFEQLQQQVWPKVEVEVIPGISALLAVAARLGAPLGQDFCVISLSDLLTPWDIIQQRLHAAAQGDFVIALYNPASQGRQWQLEAARDLLLQYRHSNTQVALARNIGRAGESLHQLHLSELRSVEVDMLSLVLIAASGTRYGNHNGKDYWYTPRNQLPEKVI